MFERHELNRPLHDDPVLFASMKEHGFMPSSPIQCIQNGSDRLKVIRGHHRLDTAKKLKLPVFYVVDDSNIDIHDLEVGRSQWTLHDFAISRASNGDVDIAKVLEFQKRHGLTLGMAASLVGGEGAGSNNKASQIKDGTFLAASDMSHANKVVAITDHCREYEIPFATAKGFVSAISMALHVDAFDSAIFIHRVTLNPRLMSKRGTAEQYLVEIEALYNFAAKKQVPLMFLAKDASRKRAANFGGHGQLANVRAARLKKSHGKRRALGSVEAA